MSTSSYKHGIIFSFSAYLIWGILPLYWALITEVGAFEILAFRVLLSAILMIVIMLFTQQKHYLKTDVQQLLRHPKQLVAIIVAGYVITINWGIFIWAVSNHHVLESSLGYYINPLVSILLALIFLRERFNKMEWVAIILAAIGVLFMTFKVGTFPFISICLALSFGVYGLLKKLVPIRAMSSITIECIVTAPVSILFLFYLHHTGQMGFGWNMDSFWLLFSGVLTATPLILFSASAQRIPLSLNGFIQYLGPTLMFILSIFVFKEHFDIGQLITFLFIWTGIIIFSVTQYVKYKRQRAMRIR